MRKQLDGFLIMGLDGVGRFFLLGIFYHHKVDEEDEPLWIVCKDETKR